MKLVPQFKALIGQWPHSWTSFKFGCLFTGSELSQQLILRKCWNEEPSPLDWGTIGRYAIWGFAIFPHVLRHWYKFLDARYVRRGAISQHCFFSSGVHTARPEGPS